MRKASDDPGGHEHPHAALMRALASACQTSDVVALASLLDPDVTVVVDGGGRACITAEPARGIGYGVALLLRVFAFQPGSMVAEHAVNGRPGLVVSRDHLVVAVISLELRRRRVQDVWIVLNPEKLERWNPS